MKMMNSIECNNEPPKQLFMMLLEAIEEATFPQRIDKKSIRFITIHRTDGKYRAEVRAIV